jgi:type IV secretion system protein VirB9
MLRHSLAALAALIILGGSAQATVMPVSAGGDPRVRTVAYAPDEVVLLTGTLGYAMTLEFAPGEKVETVSIGDALGWQVTPNRRADLLFLKPIDRAAPTNMTVVTNLRTYTFELRVRARTRGPERDVIYTVRFDVPEPAMAAREPEPPPPPPPPPRDANHAYSYQGAPLGLPTRVFDDGQVTYFAFSSTTDYPAIFAVDPDNKESAVNVSQRDGLLVVDRLAQAFVRRRGAQVTRVINDAYHPDGAQTSMLTRHKDR